MVVQRRFSPQWQNFVIIWSSIFAKISQQRTAEDNILLFVAKIQPSLTVERTASVLITIHQFSGNYDLSAITTCSKRITGHWQAIDNLVWRRFGQLLATSRLWKKDRKHEKSIISFLKCPILYEGLSPQSTRVKRYQLIAFDCRFIGDR